MIARDEQLNKALEAMYYGFRNMIKKPDEGLKKLGYSRIHHRILYFVGRNKACNINQLLAAMGVTKQYLNRPLRQLLADGYLQQQTDADDRRVKHLFLSDKGRQLEHSISGGQRQRFAQIFDQLGPEAEQHWYQVMQLLARDEED